MTLNFLGAFQALSAGEPVTRFRGEKVRALLAYLVVEADRPHARSSLAALLWPEQSDELALRNLAQALVRLRGVLGDSGALLDSTRHALQWRGDGAEVDVAAFRRLLRSADPVDLARATDLYRGEFLAGFSVPGCEAFEDWLLLTREQFQRRVLSALETLAETYQAAGDYRAAESAARRMLALDPWRETAHRYTMLACAGAGRRGAALAQYQACVTILAGELGIEPEGATTELYHGILDGTWQPGPGEAGLEQVQGAGVQPPAAPRYELPAPLTAMLGRDGELKRIVELLARDGERLVTLTGLGGVGKTRLALDAAHRLAGAGAVCWINLADTGARQADWAGGDAQPTVELASAIADALGLAINGQAPPPEQVLQTLRGRSLLLVLDNLEHLLAATPWLLALLQRAPGVQLLVTSRERLNLETEVVLPLAGLALPPTDDDPAASAYSAVQLFTQRGTRAAPSLRVHDELPQVVRLCRLLDGLPLGIELAAHWAGHYRVAEIAAALADDLGFLQSTRREVPERHRSLRAVFAYSWRMLGVDEQQALARISVFRGGFSRAAARAVAQGDVPVLAALVDKSLLRQAGVGRYVMHELLRQFAGEYLDRSVDERSAIAARHSSFYLQFVADRALRLARHEPREAAAEIRAELDNVRHAWAWAASNGCLGELARSACGVWHYYFLTGQWSEGQHAFELAITCTRQALAAVGGDQAVRRQAERIHSTLLAYHAAILQAPSSYAEAMEEARQAILLARSNRDVEGETIGCYALGKAQVRSGRVADGQQPMLRAVQLAELHQASHPGLESLGVVEWQALVWLQSINARLGDYHAARLYGTRALERCRTLDRRFGVVSCLGNRADVARKVHDLAAARADYEQALRLAPTVSYRWGEAINRVELGDVLRQQGEYGPALELTEQALTIFREIGDQVEQARAAAYLGRLYMYLGDNVRAAAWFTQFGDSAALMEAHEVTADGLLPLAVHTLQLGDAERAGQYAERAGRLARALGERYAQAHARLILADTERARGLPGAATSYHEALEQYLQLGNAALAAEPRAGLAALALAQDERDSALALVEQVLGTLATHTYVGLDEPFGIHLACYRVLDATGDTRAWAVLEQAHTRLETYCRHIDNRMLRRSFIEQVPAHSELARAWTLHTTGSTK